MKTNLIFIAVLGTVLFSCNSAPNKNLIEEQETIVEESISQNEDETTEAIVLNDGEKWVIIPEMMVFIKNMEKGVNEFSTKENPTSEEYQQLALLIDENIRKLTANCTMQGKAHDELHKWLLPFIALSEKFDVANDLNEQENIYKEFRKSFETFNVYFK